MKINTFIIFFLLLLSSCDKKSSQTLIKGEIPNLPDGVIYVYKDLSNNIIDSANTKNGRFLIRHNWVNGLNEPTYIGLDHIDKKGVLRAFYYSTNSKFKGSRHNSQFFLSDSIICFNGLINDFNPKNFNLTEKFKIVVISEVIAGYQTNALFNIDGDLFNEIGKDTYKKVLSKIKEYPNSFHLLYQINENRNSFTAIQTRNLLRLFNGETIASETYKKLKKYNEKRFNKKKQILPLLKNYKDKKTEILDAKFEKHLVVFWASWCGPCRQEIPALKNMYSKYKHEVEFVSISTDENNSSWQKALEKENMPWKQLVVNEKSNEFEPIEIFFQLSTSIPYVALVDNNMKVLKSHIGLMTEKEMEKFINN